METKNISEMAKLRLKQIEFNAITETEQTEHQAKLTSAINDFFEAFDALPEIEKEAITEVVNTNRHSGINVASKKDVTDKLYALTTKNIEKYGVRPFNTITEFKQTVGEVNYIYQNSVNNQKAREGDEKDFESQERPWGIKINKCIIIHKKQIYLSIKYNYTQSSVVVDEHNNVVDKEILNTWIKASASTEYKKEAAQKNQGVEDVVICNDFRFDTITGIKINGKEFNFKR